MSTNIVPTYPGVYVESVNKLALSVSKSATAVPVFAADDDDTAFETPTRITSWMDYYSLRVKELVKNRRDPRAQTMDLSAKNDSASVNKEAEAFMADVTNYTILDKSLRTYFENGGNYCWIMPVSKLVDEVPKYSDITLLVAAGQNIKSAVTMLCQEGKGYFAILDANKGATGASELVQDLDESEFTAAYFPWLNIQWNGKAVVDIPPSAAMAGVYCQVDVTRGVWKAPANIALKGGLKPQVKISDDFQGQLNKGKAVNMIRDFGDGTPMVWGARTCKDNDNWRYIPVRRLFNSAERDIRDAMKIALFEPNSQPTWERVRAAITRYLNDLWQSGALAGEKPEEAFFVECAKGITMDETDINQGKMIVKVGMAAVRPAEFIILQFTQDIA